MRVELRSVGRNHEIMFALNKEKLSSSSSNIHGLAHLRGQEARGVLGWKERCPGEWDVRCGGGQRGPNGEPDCLWFLVLPQEITDGPAKSCCWLMLLLESAHRSLEEAVGLLSENQRSSPQALARPHLFRIPVVVGSKKCMWGQRWWQPNGHDRQWPETFWAGNIQHPQCPASSHLCTSHRRSGVLDTKLSSGVWPSWGWMSSTGLWRRLNCQWHTDPKRWFNSALVSNPLPVTHNFLLTPEQLGQPAGEKTSRCCWLDLEGAVGLSSVQSAQGASVGQSGAASPSANKMRPGTSALSWAVSHPSTQRVSTHRAVQLLFFCSSEESYFFWEY